MNQEFYDACLSNNVDYVKRKADSIDLHEDEDYYFRTACLHGNFEIAEFLYQKGCKDYLEEVRQASEDFGFDDVVEFIDKAILRKKLKEI